MFNCELLNVFLERRRVDKAKPERNPDRKRKSIPRDDMGQIDPSQGSMVVNGIIQI